MFLHSNTVALFLCYVEICPLLLNNGMSYMGLIFSFNFYLTKKGVLAKTSSST